ncbi:MAG: hypothetical protein JW909_08920 [Planctomycetes bacterium]|nr:hypothetical protein [Planctomycetota bacterium]
MGEPRERRSRRPRPAPPDNRKWKILGFAAIGILAAAVLATQVFKGPAAMDAKMQKVQAGMSEAQVIAIMGRPEEKGADFLVWRAHSQSMQVGSGGVRRGGHGTNTTYAVWFEGDKVKQKKRFSGYVEKKEIEEKGVNAGT